MLTRVYRDLSPEVAAQFDTINTNIAASTGTVTNLASGSSQTFQDVTADPGAVTLSYHPTYGIKLPSVDLTKGVSGTMVAKFRDEAIKKVGDYMNGVVAALVNTTKFNEYTAIASGSTSDIPDAKMADAWTELAENDIQVGDLGNLFLTVRGPVYGKLLQRATWTQSAYIGDPKSGDIRSTARLGLQWGALVDFDPDLPQVSGAGYTCLLHHRNAIALVSRALAPPQNSSIPCTYVSYKGIPIRVIVDFDQTTMSDVLTFDALFGVDVVRPDHGIIITTA